MLTSWYDCLAKTANWWTIALALTLTVICIVGFNGRTLALRRQGKLGPKEKLLDGRYWYTPADAGALLCKLGRDGRRFYAVSEVTLDLIFPFAYGLSFALLLVRLWPRDQAWLLLLPFVTVIADLLENFTLAFLAWTFDGDQCVPPPAPPPEPSLAKVALVFTVTKHVFLGLAFLALVIGLVWKPFRGVGSTAAAGSSSGASPY